MTAATPAVWSARQGRVAAGGTTGAGSNTSFEYANTAFSPVLGGAGGAGGNATQADGGIANDSWLPPQTASAAGAAAGTSGGHWAFLGIGVGGYGGASNDTGTGANGGSAMGVPGAGGGGGGSGVTVGGAGGRGGDGQVTIWWW
jgi:hypothetical protein